MLASIRVTARRCWRSRTVLNDTSTISALSESSDRSTIQRRCYSHCLSSSIAVHKRPSKNVNRQFLSSSRGMDESDDEDDDNSVFGNRNRRRRKTALVLGSSGALGSSVSQFLSQKLDMKVIGADVIELPAELTIDWQLDEFIPLQPGADLTTVTTDLVDGVHSWLYDDNDAGKTKSSNKGIDAIICASGGWMGDPPAVLAQGGNDGNVTLEDYIDGAQQYSATISKMIQMNLYPVAAAGYVAQYFMNPEGLMVVIGATVALSPTPGMLGYGISKAAAHHFVYTLGASTGKSVASKATRKVARSVRQNIPALDDMTVVGILPTTLDTLANRKSFPNPDNKSWTKPIDIAKEIGIWIHTPELRPHSGGLVKVNTNADGQTSFELVR